MSNELMMWEDKTQLTEIKKLFAPKLTDIEFQAFVGMGKATGLNPFLREIWSVKYDASAPAQIFIGRDGYRKAALNNAEYEWHKCSSIYENDDFEDVNGIINHKYNFKNRGALVAAYCLVKRRSSSMPVFVLVQLREYDTKRSVWKDKPDTMLRKVAEAQALRAYFPEQFNGTYSEDEMDNRPTQTDRLKNILNTRSDGNEHIKPNYAVSSSESKDQNAINQAAELEVNGRVVDNAEFEDSATGEIKETDPILIDQLTAIRDLMNEKKFDDARKQKALEYFKVPNLANLTFEQANILIMQLEKA